jgi:hypothetical protein
VEKNPLPIEQEAGWASELVWTQRLEGNGVLISSSLNLILTEVSRDANAVTISFLK